MVTLGPVCPEMHRQAAGERLARVIEIALGALFFLLSGAVAPKSSETGASTKVVFTWVFIHHRCYI